MAASPATTPDTPRVYTVEEVGKALTNLCAAKTATLNGDKAAGFAVGRALLTEFKAAKVGELKEEQYPAFMAAIIEAGK